MKTALYLLLVVLVLNASFSYPKTPCNNTRPKSMSALKHKCCGSAPVSNKNTNSKQNMPLPCKVCNFCPVCLAFVMPGKPGIQKTFVSGGANYPEPLQGKLTDYNPSSWRPPNY
jgi:hypothetical protein